MEKVFDGSEVDLETAILPIELDIHKYDIPAKELKSIYELIDFSLLVKPDEISSILGFK